MYKSPEIDQLDLQILSFLLKNADLPYTEIAKHLSVSVGTIHVRMKKLTQMKAVTGSTVHLDLKKFGFDLSAFVGIFLEKSIYYEDVIKSLKTIPEVVSAHYTTGQYNVLIQIICRDSEHLRNVLNHKIQRIAGVRSTETLISLEEAIKRPITIYEED
jgi:Lrp/AsnC family transcriptional regulator for asnA, asnC and gidA